MTQIDFYHDASDRLQTTAKIVIKAVDQGCRVVVFVPEPALAGQIDRLLWSIPPTGFLPHCRADSVLAPETPVLLAATMDRIDGDDVLINLGPGVPPDFARFRRLIEVIGASESDKTPARERFRFYRDQGYEIRRHDLGSRA